MTENVPPTIVQPTKTVAPTDQPSPTSSPSLTPLPPTLSPLPTLPPHEAKALVLELLETNGGCELPCWWGFIPGESSWESVYTLLGQLDGEIHINQIEKNEFIATPSIPMPEEVAPSNVGYFYWFRDGVLNAIEIFDYFGTPAFAFVEMIEKYGEPSNIVIRTFKTEYGGGMPIWMIIYYYDLGMAIQYRTMGYLDDEKVHGCVTLSRKPFIWVWDPDAPTPFVEEWKDSHIEIDRWPYIPLEQVTGVTTSEFYNQSSKDPANACIETPAELWPVQ